MKKVSTGRVIKFRAWDPAREEMAADGFSFDYDHGPNNAYHENDRQIEDPVLMQFTGLHDKNGKEIYEGGVVRIEQPRLGWSDKRSELRMAKVEYADAKRDRFGFVVEYLDRGFDELRQKDWKYEVIGNIYENAELLK